MRKQLLLKEIPILRREIQSLYQSFDRRSHLSGVQMSIMFGFDTDKLGSYTQGRDESEKIFHFSLLFVGKSSRACKCKWTYERDGSNAFSCLGD